MVDDPDEPEDVELAGDELAEVDVAMAVVRSRVKVPESMCF